MVGCLVRIWDILRGEQFGHLRLHTKVGLLCAVCTIVTMLEVGHAEMGLIVPTFH